MLQGVIFVFNISHSLHLCSVLRPESGEDVLNERRRNVLWLSRIVDLATADRDIIMRTVAIAGTRRVRA